MKNLTLHTIAEVCGGTLFGGEGRGNVEITAVTTDSRAASPGCLFAAIPGEKTDGHRYIASAFEKGAACVLAERAPETCAGPVILVPSTAKALQPLAGVYRAGFDIPFIGVTGSVGKTTAKNMLAAVLSERFAVHKTPGNYNNELGVPLTLFGLRGEHTAAVIEMGISDFGEMRRLTAMVRPNYAVFTRIGEAHLEFLHDLPGVLRAKAEIIEGMGPDGIVFANGDDEVLRTLSCKQRVVFFGRGEDCDVRAEDVDLREDGSTVCTVTGGGRRFSVVIPAYGEHMIYAALAGAAVGLTLGMTDEEIARGVAAYVPEGGRGRVIETGRLTLIDDCYNANPTSVNSAIRSLSARAGRRVCILGDMLELGERSPAMHRQCGAYAVENGAALVLTCGELSRNTADGAGEKGVHFDSREDLINALPALLQPGDAVLVKASHSMRFEEIVRAIEKM